MSNKEISRDEHTNRRGFLKWMGGFTTGAIASYLANQIPPLRDYKDHFKCKKSPLAALLSPRDAVRFQRGSDHYLVPGIHSDNAIAGRFLVEAIASFVETKPKDDLSLYELEEKSDWVLIGAPSSNRLAADLLGYNFNDLHKFSTDSSLRFVYEYDDIQVKLKRHMASGAIQEFARRTSIRDLHTGNIYRPEEGGWLDEDYLLITRKPTKSNNVSRTVIGGTHGIGTRGIEVLLAHDHLSKREKETLKLGAIRGFQLLAKVEARNSEAVTKLENIRVIEVHLL